MTVTALVSGGKDSLYSAYLAETQGWPVDELLTVRPADPESMMFHTPLLDLVPLQAQAWGKAYRTVAAAPGAGAEEAALAQALAGGTGWVVAGAIASSYQWSRLHRVCHRLGRRVFTPLWGKTAHRAVTEEIAAGLDIRLAQLAAEPLGPELAGQRLDGAMLAEIERRGREVRPVHAAGEGGEYETLVVDAPFFSHRLEWDSESVESRAGVTQWRPSGVRLVRKAPAAPTA